MQGREPDELLRRRSLRISYRRHRVFMKGDCQSCFIQGRQHASTQDRQRDVITAYQGSLHHSNHYWNNPDHSTYNRVRHDDRSQGGWRSPVNSVWKCLTKGQGLQTCQGRWQHSIRWACHACKGPSIGNALSREFIFPWRQSWRKWISSPKRDSQSNDSTPKVEDRWRRRVWRHVSSDDWRIKRRRTIAGNATEISGKKA